VTESRDVILVRLYIVPESLLSGECLNLKVGDKRTGFRVLILKELIKVAYGDRFSEVAMCDNSN
jgi:hypothetical protein